jgi:hypothetical protein
MIKSATAVSKYMNPAGNGPPLSEFVGRWVVVPLLAIATNDAKVRTLVMSVVSMVPGATAEFTLAAAISRTY